MHIGYLLAKQVKLILVKSKYYFEIRLSFLPHSLLKRQCKRYLLIINDCYSQESVVDNIQAEYLSQISKAGLQLIPCTKG
jgi:hypothetical protein